jgi:hypothetical protein
MTRHVGAEALARYREGDLGGRRSSRIRAHLAGCARCAALDEDLAGVSAMLASAPRPAMPEQVTTRIQAALMAEAARRAQPGTGLGPAGLEPAGPEPTRPSARPAGPGQPGRPRHAGPAGSGRRWRRPELRSAVAARALAVAAAVVVVAGGIYGAVQLAGGTNGASSSSASGAAAGVRRGAASLAPPQAYNSAGQTATFTPVSTGLNFQPQLLRSQVRSELQRHSSVSSPPVSALPEHSGQSAPRAGPNQSSPGFGSFAGVSLAALRGCVARIAAGRVVRLVDVDQYQGKPATIIVVAAPAGGSQVWVVGPGCSRSDSDVIAQASLSGAG